MSIGNKKGMELSMNMIIVAVIGLLVLVVVIALLAGRIGNFNDETNCPSLGGTCSDDPCGSEQRLDAEGNDPCSKKGKYCCPLISG